jgi:hypothetical protein
LIRWSQLHDRDHSLEEMYEMVTMSRGIQLSGGDEDGQEKEGNSRCKQAVLNV